MSKCYAVRSIPICLWQINHYLVKSSIFCYELRKAVRVGFWYQHLSAAQCTSPPKIHKRNVLRICYWQYTLTDNECCVAARDVFCCTWSILCIAALSYFSSKVVTKVTFSHNCCIGSKTVTLDAVMIDDFTHVIQQTCMYVVDWHDVNLFCTRRPLIFVSAVQLLGKRGGYLIPVADMPAAAIAALQLVRQQMYFW